MLLAAIDENHRGTYDFIYLPIDFKVYVWSVFVYVTFELNVEVATKIALALNFDFVHQFVCLC
jgi:hypothetical protein